ncbi:hypothetical protein IAU60_004617 [Kwoniella sp. DSM 27419]
MSARPSSSSSHLPAPSVPSALHHLASPSPSLIDSQLPHYLLPSALDLLRDSATHVIRQSRAEENALRSDGLLPALDKGKGKAKGDQDREEARLIDEALAQRTERIGLMVGGYIAEKLTLARPPLASHLDIIKFICKDLFLYVYSKQIDNLRTNHRGIFVLQSHSFPPLVPLSSHMGAAADLEAAKAHLLFPQAVIQGALQRLGMQAIVIAESSGLPQCTFQIRTVKPATAQTTTPSMAGTPTPGITAQAPPGQSAQAAGQAQAQVPQARTGLGIAGTR